MGGRGGAADLPSRCQFYKEHEQQRGGEAGGGGGAPRVINATCARERVISAMPMMVMAPGPCVTNYDRHECY